MATCTDPELEQLLQDFPHQGELDRFNLDPFADMNDPFAFIDFNGFPSSPLTDLPKTNMFTLAPVTELSDSPSKSSSESFVGSSDEKGSLQTANHQLEKLEEMIRTLNARLDSLFTYVQNMTEALHKLGRERLLTSQPSFDPVK